MNSELICCLAVMAFVLIVGAALALSICMISGQISRDEEERWARTHKTD